MSKEKMGLVRFGPYLLWGYRHGAGINWPDWIKELIISEWNGTVCVVRGHRAIRADAIATEEPDPCCPHCCTPL